MYRAADPRRSVESWTVRAGLPVRGLSWPLRHAETGRRTRIERTLHIGIDLRRIDVPKCRELADRIGFAPVAAPVDARPGHFAHDQKPRRVNGSGLPAPRQTG